MYDPNTTIMIHQTMIQEELQRSHPEHHLTFVERDPGRGAIAIARTITARALLALGGRISPSTEPGSERCVPLPDPAPRGRRLGAG